MAGQDYWEFDASREFLKDPIWNIPNVKAKHPEKTFHPCQFPVELVERCILALTSPGDLVLDPFVGTGTSVIAALKHQRSAYGIDRDKRYLKEAEERIESFFAGTLKVRAIGTPVRTPNIKDRVARVPDEWRDSGETSDGKGKKRASKAPTKAKAGSYRKKKTSRAKSSNARS